MATVMWPPKIVQYTLVWICSYLFHAYYYLSQSPHLILMFNILIS